MRPGVALLLQLGGRRSVIKGQKIEIGGKTPYHKWIEGQGIPVIRDYYIEDLRKVELAPWDWKGGRGVYLNLIGTGDANDAYICEIAPGSSLKPHRVLFEELIFVVEGNGASSIWNDESKKVTFEWQEGRPVLAADKHLAPALQRQRYAAGAPLGGDLGAADHQHVPEHGLRAQQYVLLQ